MDAHFPDTVHDPQGSGAPPTPDDGNATFGQLLRAAREERGVTLEAIAARTNIPLKHLRALERDDLSGVPPGMYQRAEIRAFAGEVGLDPRIALAALERAKAAASASLAAAPASGTGAGALSRSATASDPTRVASNVAVGTNASSAQPQSSGRLRFAIAALAILITGGFGLRSLMNTPPASSPARQTERPDAAQPPATRQTSIATSAVSTTEAPATDRPAAAQPPAPPQQSIATSGVSRTKAPAPERRNAARPPAPPQHSNGASGVSITEAPATAGATQFAGPESATAVGLPVDYADLRIVTEPPGARVTVDGIGWGETPLTIRYLPPGSKRIRVTRDGYVAQERVVQLSSDTLPTTVRISLQHQR